MHKPQFSSEIGAVLKNATILGVKKKTLEIRQHLDSYVRLVLPFSRLVLINVPGDIIRSSIWKHNPATPGDMTELAKAPPLPPGRATKLAG